MIAKRLWIFAGLLAPVCYTAAVLLGGALMPGYSHLRDAISSLTQTGAPVIPSVYAFFIAYNVLILIFAAGLWQEMRRQGHRLAAAGALVLAAVGLSGVLMFYFTQDPIGAPLTIRGIGHFVLAGVEALGTIAACLLCGLGFRRIPALASLRTYSVVSALVIFIVGGANTATISIDPYFGLFERVTIFTYMIWTFVVALRLTEVQSLLTARRAAV